MMRLSLVGRLNDFLVNLSVYRIVHVCMFAYVPNVVNVVFDTLSYICLKKFDKLQPLNYYFVTS